ncbi:MAG: hypothetical protein WD712_03095 [Candidatus Spechtbacterales bacterium]
MLSGRKIKISEALKGSRKKFALLAATAVAAPLLLLILFFYGGLNLSKISSAFNFVFRENPETSRESRTDRSDLRLISRQDFIKKYNPKPAYLPQALEIHSSLSGYVKSNSTSTLLPVRNWSVPFVDIKAESALAIDLPGARILYGKNVFEPRPIASLTKLMTALVAAEHMNLSDVATVSQNAVRTEGSSASLLVGEELTIEQLLYAALLESSNDAAVAIQEFYDGSREAGTPSFVDLMNQKAGALTLKDTSFVEPSGLSAENKTTAFGVASILWAAFQNENVARILGTSNYTTEPLNKEFTHYWVNLNTLIGAYGEIIAGKTGYTEEAGPSMTVLSATPNANKFVAIVVLNAYDRIEESTNLLNWVKQAYIWEE